MAKFIKEHHLNTFCEGVMYDVTAGEYKTMYHISVKRVGWTPLFPPVFDCTLRKRDMNNKPIDDWVEEDLPALLKNL